MKFLLIVVNFVFLFFCFTNSYSDEIKLNDIIPSTDLTVLIETGYTWGLTQINDGITEDLSPYNGFVSSQTEGTITLELVDEYDLSKFLLWNDVNVSKEGIRQFRLEFYNKLDTIISESQTFTANSQLNANEFVFDNIVIGVKKVNLIILAASHQIEIRELEFIGEKHCSCIVDSDSDGVIDQWDKCPNTNSKSVILSNGCSVNIGDINLNGKLDIVDSINILQSLTNLQEKYYKSCKEIMDNNNGSSSGIYTIDPDGNGNIDKFEVYCDMQTDGGGWTLVMNAPDVSYTYTYMISSNSTKDSTNNYKKIDEHFLVQYDYWGEFSELRYWCLNDKGNIGDAKVEVSSQERVNLDLIKDKVNYKSGVALGDSIIINETNEIFSTSLSVDWKQDSTGENNIGDSNGWGGYWSPYKNNITNSECNNSNNANDGSGKSFKLWVR